MAMRLKDVRNNRTLQKVPDGNLKTQFKMSLRNITGILNMLLQSYTAAIINLKYIVYITNTPEYSEAFSNKLEENLTEVQKNLTSSNNSLRELISKDLDEIKYEDCENLLENCENYVNEVIKNTENLKNQKYNYASTLSKNEKADDVYITTAEKFSVSADKSIETGKIVLESISKAYAPMREYYYRRYIENITIKDRYEDWQFNLTQDNFRQYLPLIQSDWPNNPMVFESILRHLEENTNFYGHTDHCSTKLKTMVFVTKLFRIEAWRVSDYLVDREISTALDTFLKSKIHNARLDILDRDLPFDVFADAINTVLGSDRLAEISILCGHRPEEIFSEYRRPLRNSTMNDINYTYLNILKESGISKETVNKYMTVFPKYLNNDKDNLLTQPMAEAVSAIMGGKGLNRIISDPIFREKVNLRDAGLKADFKTKITYRKAFLTSSVFCEAVSSTHFASAIVHQFGKYGMFACLKYIRENYNFFDEKEYF